MAYQEYTASQGDTQGYTSQDYTSQDDRPAPWYTIPQRHTAPQDGTPAPAPCTPFTDPVDLSWYTAAELNKNCCEQKSLCCRVNSEGDVAAAPFFLHGAGPSGSPTLSQARAYCGVTGTADDGAGTFDPSAPQTVVTTSTSGETHNRMIWMIVGGVLVLVLLVVVYMYFAKSNKTASAPATRRPAPMTRETLGPGAVKGEPNPFL